MKHKIKLPTIQKPLLTTVIGLVIVWSAVNTLMIANLNRLTETTSNQHVADLIIGDVEALNHPLNVEAASGKGYIPEAHLSLPPASLELGRILYSYNSSIDEKGSSIELHLVSDKDVTAAAQPLRNIPSDNIDSTFNNVPRLQACGRGITIDFQPLTNVQLITQKTLQDGRVIYMFGSKDCANEQLLEYAKQIDSY